MGKGKVTHPTSGRKAKVMSPRETAYRKRIAHLVREIVAIPVKVRSRYLNELTTDIYSLDIPDTRVMMVLNSLSIYDSRRLIQ